MRSLAGVLAILATACFATHAAAAQIPAGSEQEALIRDLLSNDRDRVARAVGLLPVDYDGNRGWVFRGGYEATTALVEALIVALERENRLFRDEDGGGLGSHLELPLELLHVVIATRDSSTTGVLTRMLWTGGAARQALLSFGPGALPEVLDLAESPMSTNLEASSALLALQEAARQWEAVLDPEIRSRMKEVTILYLKGPPDHFVSYKERHWTFSRAVGLAEALQDPELIALARSLAGPGRRR